MHLLQENESQYPAILLAFHEKINSTVEAGIFTKAEALEVTTFTPLGLQLMNDLEQVVVEEAATQAKLHGKSNSTPAPLRLLNALLLQDARANASKIALAPGDFTVPEVEAAMITLQERPQLQLETEVSAALVSYRRAYPADSLLVGDALRARLNEQVANISVYTARRNLEESIRWASFNHGADEKPMLLSSRNDLGSMLLPSPCSQLGII